MMNTLTMMMWIMSLMFLFMNHPLSFGLILLIQTILTMFITGMMSLNFWYSYILFLIMIGGMLVLFMYMTSIASNEKFKFSLNLTYLFLMSFLILPLTLLMNNNIKYFNENFISQNKSSMYQLSMNKYMYMPSMMIYLMIIIYLFITLIAIVKITNISYGPLRQKF
uniref:NADH-ubiquinone oxidoreductase chain 6 n=1 Tax=Thesaurus albertalleni TaxID=2529511 RepID=A0A7G7MUB9_9CUCU|nr:NADH dehydrogenase subunit 6 [Thesaurus albertalleni]QNG56428.1 NADH dehydrogenase subunit 6 [Thesaurus albertalleni]